MKWGWLVLLLCVPSALACGNFSEGLEDGLLGCEMPQAWILGDAAISFTTLDESFVIVLEEGVVTKTDAEPDIDVQLSTCIPSDMNLANVAYAKENDQLQVKGHGLFNKLKASVAKKIVDFSEDPEEIVCDAEPSTCLERILSLQELVDALDAGDETPITVSTATLLDERMDAIEPCEDCPEGTEIVDWTGCPNGFEGTKNLIKREFSLALSDIQRDGEASAEDRERLSELIEELRMCSPVCEERKSSCEIAKNNVLELPVELIRENQRIAGELEGAQAQQNVQYFSQIREDLRQVNECFSCPGMVDIPAWENCEPYNSGYEIIDRLEDLVNERDTRDVSGDAAQAVDVLRYCKPLCVVQQEPQDQLGIAECIPEIEALVVDMYPDSQRYPDGVFTVTASAQTSNSITYTASRTNCPFRGFEDQAVVDAQTMQGHISTGFTLPTTFSNSGLMDRTGSQRMQQQCPELTVVMSGATESQQLCSASFTFTR